MPKAYIKNIRSIVLRHLRNSCQSIEVAVAWFTDYEIFELLLTLLQQNISVTVIITNDTINQKAGFDWSIFGKLGGQAYLYGDDTQTMHHKFCIIDGQILLSGSYNWTYRAARANRENLIVFTGKDRLDLLPFQQEFREMIAESTLLTPEIRLSEENPPLIQTEIIRNPAIDRLKARIQILEIELSVLQENKIRLEEHIERYIHRLRVELGDMLTRIADLKIQLAKRIAQRTNRRSDAERVEELREAFENIRQQVTDAVTQPHKEPPVNPSDEVRQLYYKVAMKAHPDRFLNNPDQYARATAFMAELNRAYAQRDIDALRRLADELENGQVFRTDLTSETDWKILENLLQQLEQRKAELEQAVASLKTHDAFDWDDTDAYFQRLYEQLTQQVQTLEEQLSNA